MQAASTSSAFVLASALRSALQPALAAGALVYLQGGSEATQYLQYLPVAANLSAGTNLTRLAPVVQDQQYIVRDWPLAGAERSSSSSSSSSEGGGSEGSGRDEGGGSAADLASSGRYVYAVVYSAEQRNGQLVVAPLGPDALVDAAGGAQGSAPAANSTATEAAPAPAPAPAAASNQTDAGAVPAPAPSPAAAPTSAPAAAAEPGGNATAGSSGSASSNATASGSESESGGGSGSSSGNATGADRITVLQAHSWEIEIVDITVSSGYLAVLERRNGTLVATAYPLPKDGGLRVSICVHLCAVGLMIEDLRELNVPCLACCCAVQSVAVPRIPRLCASSLVARCPTLPCRAPPG